MNQHNGQLVEYEMRRVATSSMACLTAGNTDMCAFVCVHVKYTQRKHEIIAFINFSAHSLQL